MEAVYTSDDLSLKRYFSYSVLFHLALTALMLVGIWLQRTGESWGGPGSGGDSAVKVNLSASIPAAGIPMPPEINPTDSQVIDPTKGLNMEEPQPKPPEEPKDTATIPKFEKEKPLPPSKKSKVFENKTPPPPNAINYGRGGNPRMPTSYSTEPGPLTNSGIAATGQGGGDFASRYGWYIEAVRRLVSQNWMQNTIDPAVRSAGRARTTVTFTIERDGSVKNIKIAETSGNRSMDDSAMRALLSIDRFNPLPSDYSGTYVNVTFDFDLSMVKQQ
jgi:periplasmic protein TonB